MKAAHILVPLAENASDEEQKKALATMAEIRTKLQKGTSFADLANAYNKAGAAEAGGELGWIERGVTVKPFEEALFALEPGKVSEPVRTQFGLHLILAHEKRPLLVRPLAEVKAELLKSMASELGRDRVSEVGEVLLEEMLLGKDLAENAKRFGLSAEQSGPLTSADLLGKLKFSAADATLLLSGTPVDTLLEADGEVLVVKVDGIDAESQKPLAEVTAEIKQKLLEEKALTAAKAEAEKVRANLNSAPMSPEQKKALHVEQTAEAWERNGDKLPPFEGDQSITQAVFAAKVNEWLGQVFSAKKLNGPQGALLIKLAAVEPAKAEDWERIHTFIENGYQREAAQNLQNVFLNELMKKSRITDVNQEKADRADG